MSPTHTRHLRPFLHLSLALGLLATVAVLFVWASPAASAPEPLVPIEAARMIDTRSGRDISTVDGLYRSGGAMRGGSTAVIQVAGRGGVDREATAIVANFTVVGPKTSGHLRTFPCGEMPNASSLNYEARAITSNTVLTKLDDQGRVCVFSSSSTHLVVDVQGFTTVESPVKATTPARIVDTRFTGTTVDGRSARQGAIEGGAAVGFDVAGRGGVPVGAEAAVVNVTAINPDSVGQIIVGGCRETYATETSIQFEARTITSNSVLVPLDAGGQVCAFTTSQTDILVDVFGYVVPTDMFTVAQPISMADTRVGSTTVDGTNAGTGPLQGGSTLRVPVAGRGDVPTDATSAVVHLTAEGSRDAGYATVYACTDDVPLASNLNYRGGEIASNTAFTELDSRGRVCVYVSSTTHVSLEVQGYSHPGADVSVALAPVAAPDEPSEAPPTTAAPTLPPATTVSPTTTSTTSTTTTTLAPVTLPSTTTSTTTLPPVTLPPATTSTSTLPPVTLPPTTVAPQPEPSDGAGFVHPGVLVDRTQLEEIRANVAAGREPWASAFDQIRRSSFGSLSYRPTPFSVIQDASSGYASYVESHGMVEMGGQEHTNDATAAYTQALLWSATGNQAHADKAIEIMNAWSSTLTEIKFDSPVRDDNGLPVFNNGKLQAGWGGTLFARAAEIIRHSNAGWSSSDVARFENMLTDVYLPLTITGWTNGSNWLMTLSEATMSIGVFTNDRSAFEAGVAYWRAKAPTTVYHPADGPTPIAPASFLTTTSKLKSYWYSPTQYVTGLQQEALRDFGHTTMGLGALANAAETAYIQGIDLYGEQAARITAGFELQAGFVNDYYDEVQRLGGKTPASTWIPAGWPGAAGTFHIGNTFHKSGWLVAHHHYTTRTGTALPETTRLVQRLGNTANQPTHHISWEPLTHS